MDVVIFDLGALQVAREPGRCQVRAPSLASLASVPVPCGTGDQEAVFMALDAVLDTALVATRPGHLARVGLYNPFTAEVALSAVPQTRSFGDGQPLQVPLAGLPAVALGDCLQVGDRLLPRLEPSTASVLRAIDRSRP